MAGDDRAPWAGKGAAIRLGIVIVTLRGTLADDDARIAFFVVLHHSTIVRNIAPPTTSGTIHSN